MQLYLGFETVSYLLLQRMASIEIDRKSCFNSMPAKITQKILWLVLLDEMCPMSSWYFYMSSLRMAKRR